MTRSRRIAQLAQRVAPLAAAEEHQRLHAELGAVFRQILEDDGREHWQAAEDEHWREWCEANGEEDFVVAFYEALEERAAEIKFAEAEALRRRLGAGSGR